ncbi:YtxH domain-containing protein [Actinomyces bowdenii]|uniref:YtxH domain-containing protein n=1 Tax=Actinomyces bowdenii TaxID=131109 RepID=A0A3P1VET7_9ACTO|nr:YtxH domain-containing protein [Actinomyces bowdenii]MBO3723484.1 YtxH domain-containing protein [Actinomyces bowdenii]RRD30953.1 YtxH domain-containing protein [Actinomyces bowdenii]
MAGKIPFIIGLGAGYVLGTRAGRAQYERIKATASRVAEQPYVREKVDAASARVGQAVRAQGEAVTEKVADAVKERLFGSSRSTAAPAAPVQVDDAQVRPLS